VFEGVVGFVGVGVVVVESEVGDSEEGREGFVE
jgi:hypothetical protein